MSENSALIKKIKTLIEDRRRTIKANKRQMKDNLKEYKKNLELDRKLKAECRTLQEAVYGLLRSLTSSFDTQDIPKNTAINRQIDIVIDDEE